MKDIPAFTTGNGAAGLILKEIPYRGEAYIKIHSTLSPEALVEECVGFCRACGAEKIYITEEYANDNAVFHTAVWEMRGRIEFDRSQLPSMFPVTEKTAAQWREIYNQGMRSVDNAATLESRDEVLLLKGGAYFIHREGTLLGIAWINENELKAVVSLRPGAGADICRAVQSLVPDELLTLSVASTNQRAIRLYEKLGMMRIRELSRWYRIF